MPNIIKPILQVKQLELIEVTSVAWHPKVIMCRVETTWLQVHDPLCYAMQKGDASHSRGWGEGEQEGKGCCSCFTERQESSDLSKVIHCLNCSRTRSRYKVCRICGPALSQWLLELAGWVAILFKPKIISARLSWSVCIPTLDTREFDLEIKHSGYKPSIISIIGLTCSGKSSFHEAYKGN